MTKIVVVLSESADVSAIIIITARKKLLREEKNCFILRIVIIVKMWEKLGAKVQKNE
jgi:hypothetical protein